LGVSDVPSCLHRRQASSHRKAALLSLWFLIWLLTLDFWLLINSFLFLNEYIPRAYTDPQR
ncbi:MAG: hypothetical protein M3531_32790, partial [Pseudomonadota bacterium]|nr:hypothetical protein [Pseudomonadota bacterium]